MPLLEHTVGFGAIGEIEDLVDVRAHDAGVDQRGDDVEHTCVGCNLVAGGTDARRIRLGHHRRPAAGGGVDQDAAGPEHAKRPASGAVVNVSDQIDHRVEP